MNIKFCVSLTSIPTRIKNVHQTINSLKKQSLKPDKIFLNIPYKYKRFQNSIIDEMEIKKVKAMNVEITRCEDYGPATKLMGSLKKIMQYDCVVFLDDDHIYNSKMCEIFIEEFKKKKINYSFYLQKIFKLNMGQGADGFLINTEFLKEIEKFYLKYVIKNENLLMDDDLWISIYLQFIQKKEIKNLKDILLNKTGEKVVYKIHSSIDSLKDGFHKPKKFFNRRKIAKIEYIRFKIKNLFTKNFIDN